MGNSFEVRKSPEFERAGGLLVIQFFSFLIRSGRSIILGRVLGTVALDNSNDNPKDSEGTRKDLNDEDLHEEAAILSVSDSARASRDTNGDAANNEETTHAGTQRTGFHVGLPASDVREPDAETGGEDRVAGEIEVRVSVIRGHVSAEVFWCRHLKETRQSDYFMYCYSVMGRSLCSKG